MQSQRTWLGGGVGLKRAAEMNKALLAKLAWRVITNRDDIWSQMISKKIWG